MGDLTPNKIIILNGPNLNLLGRREPSIYGTDTMESILLRIQRRYPDLHITYRQSNHEGDLIDWIQQADAPVVLNAGGYTHTSVSLRDAIAFLRQNNTPVVEVHISDITRREEFRRTSLLTDVCIKTVTGKNCYEEAVAFLVSDSVDC